MITVGVLALQGGFSEHLVSLRKAAGYLSTLSPPRPSFQFVEVRNSNQLSACDALVIPGGESTTLSLVAAQSGLLEPLRKFVNKKPTWGTCAGLIFLSEQASAAKRGGQELVGGLDVKVHRNHFGRQRESFVTDLELPFLSENTNGATAAPFPAVFIRAPVVDQILSDDVNESIEDSMESITLNNATEASEDPLRRANPKVEILAVLPGRHASNKKATAAVAAGLDAQAVAPKGEGDIVALRQGNVFGTSFHPELTGDIRIHVWWLEQIAKS